MYSAIEMIEHSLSVLVPLLGRVSLEYSKLLHPLIVGVLVVLAVLEVGELCKSEILYNLLILAHGRQNRVGRELILQLTVNLIHKCVVHPFLLVHIQI